MQWLIDLAIAMGTLLLAGAVVAAVLNWSEIESWLTANRTPSADVAEFVRAKLQSGEVEVVANVLNRNNKILAQQAWKAKTLGPDVEVRFGGRDTMRVKL